MVVTLGQQYNIGEKPTVILYTYINRLAGTPEKQRRQNSTPSNIIIYCYTGYKDKFTTTTDIETRTGRTMMWIIFMIQKVQDTVIHLEVDEEQWEITQGSKRQAERTGFLAQSLSGLRHTDAPHTWTYLWSRVDQKHKLLSIHTFRVLSLQLKKLR